MRHSARIIAFVTLGCLGASIRAETQGPPVVRVRDEPTCPRCTIEVKTVARLEIPDGPQAGQPPRVAMDSRGRYWVTAYNEMPGVYDAEGKLLQSIGRRGQGPREFQNAVEAFTAAGDSMVILDVRNARATIVGPDLAFGRMIRVPYQISFAVVVEWPQQVIANGILGGRGRAASVLHRFSLAGEEIVEQGSFGIDTDSIPQSEMYARVQLLSRSRTGTVWATDRRRYRMTEWRADGTPVRVIERAASFFPTGDASSIGTPSTPPTPSMRGVMEGPDGLLWAVMSVAAPSWKEGWARAPAGAREVSTRDIDIENIYDTMIELIDPQTGRVVARQRYRGYVSAVLGGGRAVLYSVDSDGEAHIDLVDLALKRR